MIGAVNHFLFVLYAHHFPEAICKENFFVNEGVLTKLYFM